MNPALFALGLALLAGTALAVASALRLRSILGFVLAAYVLAVAEVVVLSQLLSLGRAVSREGYVVGEAVLLAGAVWVWNRAGRPRPPRPRLAWADARRHPIVAALAFVVALSVLYALAIGVVTPPNNSDSMTYRLARAAAWLEHGGLHWIADPHTERLNEFPPNSELELLYTLTLLDSDAGAALPQLAALVAIVVAVAGSARRLGYGRAAAAFAGLLTATLAEVALQSTSTQNDLVTASLVAAAAYFVRSPRAAELSLAGASAGLALGTKLTAWVVLPVLALLAATSLPPRRIAAAAAAVAAGAVLFAGQIVVLNLEHTGSPLGRAEESDLYRSTLTARGAVSTGARIAYRSVDFTGFPIAPSVRETLEDAGERSFELLGITPNPPESSGSLFTFALNLRAHEDHSFFGPLGFLLVLPLSLVFAAAWPLRRTSAAHAAHALALPLSVLALALTFRFTDEGRYLIVPVVLTMSLAASVYRWRVVALAAAAVGVVALVGSHADNELKPIDRDLTRSEAQSLDVPFRQPALAAVERRVPDTARLGVALAPSDWAYPLYGRSLDRTLVPVDRDCPMRDAERKGLRHVFLGSRLGWPGLPAGWSAERFPRAGTLLVRTGQRRSRAPCFVYTWPR